MEEEATKRLGKIKEWERGLEERETAEDHGESGTERGRKKWPRWNEQGVERVKFGVSSSVGAISVWNLPTQ